MPPFLTPNNKIKLYNFLTYLRKVMYWGLPPLILLIIFRQVNWQQIMWILSRADPALILMGVTLIIPIVATAGVRWFYMLRRCGICTMSAIPIIGEYWKSQPLGLFLPGSLGSDVYRVIVIGRENNGYLRSIFVIGIEKIVALFACLLLIAALYPLLDSHQLTNHVEMMMSFLYAILLSMLAAGIFVLCFHQMEWSRRLQNTISAKFDALVRRLGGSKRVPGGYEAEGSQGRNPLMLSTFFPSIILPVTALSLAIQFIAATQVHLYFEGLGYDIPYTVNLFVTPLIFILFTLPISFAGIGIREGAYILLYGAFGVPAELALIVSFLGLIGSLLTYAIGACLFMINRHDKIRVPTHLNQSPKE